MMIKRYCLFFSLVLLGSGSAYSQNLYERKIAQLVAKEQKCLDSGADMRGCSSVYYQELDSMLNVVYRAIRIKLNVAEQQKLKQSQLSWLKQRDTYFKKIPKMEKASSDLRGADFDMVVIQQEAKYVYSRIKFLMNKYRLE